LIDDRRHSLYHLLQFILALLPIIIEFFGFVQILGQKAALQVAQLAAQ